MVSHQVSILVPNPVKKLGRAEMYRLMFSFWFTYVGDKEASFESCFFIVFQAAQFVPSVLGTMYSTVPGGIRPSIMACCTIASNQA